MRDIPFSTWGPYSFIYRTKSSFVFQLPLCPRPSVQFIMRVRICTLHALIAYMLPDVSDYTGTYLISVYLFRHRKSGRQELDLPDLVPKTSALPLRYTPLVDWINPVYRLQWNHLHHYNIFVYPPSSYIYYYIKIFIKYQYNYLLLGISVLVNHIHYL